MSPRARGHGRSALEIVFALASVAAFAVGCTVKPASEGGARVAESREAPDEAVLSARIFADSRFYRERPEPEESLRGILHTVEVREGPNTREHPLELEMASVRYGVYVSGVDPRVLAPFVGRAVEVTGKRIDLRSEGFGVEIWIGTISLAGDRPGREDP